MRWRRPVGLEQLDANAAVELARLGGFEGLSRSVMVGVVPLAALEALGSKAAVSYAFIGGQMITLMITINVGWLERKMPRRWVVTLASSFLVVAAGLFLVADGPLFVLAVGLRSAEASIFAVCMSLYIMDYIGKRDLTSTESRRMVYLGAAWVIGPTLGVWLWSNAHTSAPFLISIVMTLVTAGYFWRLRLHRNPVLLTPTTAIPNAVHSMVRFFRQRNLRIAYAITTSRAIFWAALFVYGPIYVVESGLPTWAAGVFLSAASGMLFISPMVRVTADRLGTRAVIIGALGVMSASMVALAIIGDARKIGLVFWLTGALGGAAVDMLGNIPFMRLVKPRERVAMTAIFTTWRETSFLLAPVIGAVALGLGSFWLLYLVIAMLLASAAIATSFLPRRL